MSVETIIRKAKYHWISASIAEKNGAIEEAIYHCGIVTGLLLTIDKIDKEQNRTQIVDITLAVLKIKERLI